MGAFETGKGHSYGFSKASFRTSVQSLRKERAIRKATVVFLRCRGQLSSFLFSCTSKQYVDF